MPTLSQLVEILNSVCDYYISTEEINHSKTIYSYIKQLAEKYNEIHYQKQILVCSVDRNIHGNQDAIYLCHENKKKEALMILNGCLLENMSCTRLQILLGQLYYDEAKMIVYDSKEMAESIYRLNKIVRPTIPLRIRPTKYVLIVGNEENQLLLYDAVNNAESNYKAVINRDPRYTSVWYHLGDLYKLIGYNEKASNAYLTALEYDKQLPLVQFETVLVPL